MTKQQYENHFYRMPGAWTGNFVRGTAYIVVDETKTGEAIRYITGFGFAVTCAEVSKGFPDGIKLRIK